MALPGSGPMSLAQLQTEFGGSNPVSLSEYYRGGAYVTANNTGVPVSGQVSLSQFYGAVRQFAFTISTNYSTPQNLRDLALAAGWNGSDFLLATNSAILSSNSTATAALTISGSFPNGVSFINNSYILGMGGRGGDTTSVGSAGGPALLVASAATVTNNGTLAGGGGGGGAGVYWAWNGFSRSMAGSGGASGLTAAAGGLNPSSGVGGSAYPSSDSNGDGIYETPGASFNWGWGGRLSSPGGRGGNWGSAGDAGGTVDGNYNYSGYAGGAGGAAVSGNSNVTWVATGTRYGALA